MRGELRCNEPMSKHTSWRVGGPADIWYRPADREDLQDFLASHQQPPFWLGLGSNLLVRDGGLRGAVVTLYDALNGIEIEAHGQVYVEAGAHCARLAKSCAERGLAGAAFFAGIPGTLGGALAMNAGAHGDETWSHVLAIDWLSPQGLVQRIPADQFVTSYRSVELPDEHGVFLGAQLQFELGDAQQEMNELRALLKRRRESQPVGQPSCGSVFRNPPGDYAARLIESCGLKGFAIGGAKVSDKHANFIINAGDASAADIEGLIEHVADVVEQAHGCRLLPEVRIVGEYLQ